MKEEIKHSWNFGKEFFQMLSEMRKNHLNCAWENNVTGMVTSLIDEADFISPDITQKEDKKTIKQAIEDLTKIEKNIKIKNNKRITLKDIHKIREERRKIWKLERKYKLDHPDTTKLKDPSDSITET